MASIDKKIIQKGWSEKGSMSRTAFSNAFEKMETERVKFKSKKRFVCKKNKGEHVLVLVPPNGEPKMGQSKAQYEANVFVEKDNADKNVWRFRGADVYECSKCGHIEIIWKK